MIICCNKIYALFGVNSFLPEIMVVYNLGHLEGLYMTHDIYIESFLYRCYYPHTPRDFLYPVCRIFDDDDDKDHEDHHSHVAEGCDEADQ